VLNEKRPECNRVSTRYVPPRGRLWVGLHPDWFNGDVTPAALYLQRGDPSSTGRSKGPPGASSKRKAGDAK
jgi:hypothetical protein